jgi:CheY-like chemotaxis protein
LETERQGGRYAPYLVVDDDLHVGLAIRAWLVQHGFRVTIADGGTNGLAALDTSNFNLMIVDVFMPHMRGFDSIRLFHQRALGAARRDLRLRLFRFRDVGRRLREYGGNTRRARFLRKPFGPATLLNVIDECLSAAEPHRKYVATLSAVTNAVFEPQRDANARGGMKAEATGR